MKSRTLWIVPKWPFPAQDGARVATASLLRNYHASGRHTDLLAIAGEDESCDEEQARRELGVDRCFVIRRPPTHGPALARLLRMGLGFVLRPWVPITMRNYALPPVRRAIDGVISRGWDTIVYDGLHTAIHSTSLGRYRRPAGVARVIYRAHNHETGIWERNAARTSNPVTRALLRLQAGLVGAVEHSLASVSDGVATVSPEDLAHFRARTSIRAGLVTPIGYEFDDPPPVPLGSPSQIMFLGRMDWAPNRDGLIWFLKEVWPKILGRRPDLRLAIAGSGDAAPIKPYLAQERVEFRGRVDDLEKLYRDSIVSLAPIFYGSGTRVKVIEASRFGRACLSTALGVEGVGLEEGKSYLRAETAEEWIDAIASLTPAEAQRAGHEAHASLRSRFDASEAARAFGEWIEGLPLPAGAHAPTIEEDLK